MTGWLPKEILDHLEHAGYVAIPKERVETLWSQRDADHWELMARREHGVGIGREIQQDLARIIAIEMLKRGFLDVEQSLVDGDRIIRHRASVIVLKPRTIKPEAS
jgi:hypothetical protein